MRIVVPSIIPNSSCIFRESKEYVGTLQPTLLFNSCRRLAVWGALCFNAVPANRGMLQLLLSR